MISGHFGSLVDFRRTMSGLGSLPAYIKGFRDLFETWGLLLDLYQQAAYSAITNQFSPMPDGYGAQDPSGLYREFGLPPHPAFLANKFQHATDRHTKVGLCRMLALIGHTAVRIHTGSSSHDASDILAGDPIYTGSFNSFPFGAQTGALTSRYTYAALGGTFSVAIYDMLDYMPAQLGSTTIGQELGRPADGKPQWAHIPQDDTELIRQIVEYHEGSGEACLEIFYCFLNNSTHLPSTFDATGAPSSSNDNISIRAIHLGLWESGMGSIA